VIDRVVGALALARGVALVFDLDLEEAGAGLAIQARARLEARPDVVDVIGEAAQVGRVEVDALVGERLAPVDLEDLMVVGGPRDDVDERFRGRRRTSCPPAGAAPPWRPSPRA
jgi:hypothetical protein